MCECMRARRAPAREKVAILLTTSGKMCKNTIFLKKRCKIFWQFKKKQYFCTRFPKGSNFFAL